MIEKTISNFISSQFPDFYQEEGDRFISFVKAYYEWLELQGNVTHEARNLEDYLDIDTTPDEFIVYFKEKYLKNIQFQLTSNKKLAIKHSLDLYRAKGTDRAVDLFFKLIYGTSSYVSYPGDDIFKLSSGNWVRPTYLEVRYSPYLVEYVGKQITGVLSNSKAFVEKYIRRKTNRGYVNILYVSNITGSFINNEGLNFNGIFFEPVHTIGSLNSIQIIDGGKDFEVGEIVEIVSSSGVNAKAKVTSIETSTGEVDFTFIDGGTGYTSNAEILIANNTIIVSNVNSNTGDYFNTFEVITQPLANIVFSNSSISITTESILHSGNAYGKVISTNQTGNTGNFVISVTNGSFTATSNLYNESNTFVAYINSVANTSATAKVLKKASQVTIETTTSPNTEISIFDVAYQKSGNTTYASGTVQLNTDRTFLLRDVSGAFRKDDYIYFKNSSFVSNVGSLSIFVDLFAVNGTFTSTNSPLVYTPSGNGQLTTITGGDSAGFSLSTVSNNETVYLNTDIITANLLATPLSANSFGLPKNPAANLSSTFGSCLTYGVFNIGTIQDITGIAPGENYENSPGVLIHQPYISAFQKHDYIIQYSNATSNFISGEYVQQQYSGNNYLVGISNTSGFIEGSAVYQGNNYAQIKQVVSNTQILLYETTAAFTNTANIVSYNTNTSLSVANVTAVPFTDYVVGRVKSANSTALFVMRTQFKHDFISNSSIVGLSSNTRAQVSDVFEDISSPIMGLNANVNSTVFQSNGIIKTLSVIDSGFGYYDNTAIVVSEDMRKTAIAAVYNSNYGIGAGYYKTSNGFLSANKFLYDGDFYQEYSYEVFSRLPFEKYSQMLKKVMHVAGTRLFGAVLINSSINNSNTIVVSQITQS